MINKNKSLALERPSRTKKKDDSLHHELSKETDLFKSRNQSSVNPESICPRCLKAHLTTKALELDLDDEIKKINSLLDCELGHDGYYLDSEKLVKLDLEED